eukprot:TRINITY_DN356_c0_g2_i1.p1 TRINITY_DN356_c0_g2~~TRINITY_DN356_c0_g2_i1.p1  ORF type:complete len:720 (-),score=198.97 TRINITY_DN356_c0_g2_i1:689-2815(-)
MGKRLEEERAQLEAAVAEILGHGDTSSLVAETRQFRDTSAARLAALRGEAQLIKERVGDIAKRSSGVLGGVSVLKNRKQNLETLLNVLTAHLELTRILPLLERLIEAGNRDEVLRHVRILKRIEVHLLREFVPREIERLSSVYAKVLTFARGEFEDAVRRSDTSKMTFASAVFSLLEGERDVLARTMDVYARTLETDLSRVKEDLSKFLSKSPMFDSDAGHTSQVFLNGFVECLGRLAALVDAVNEEMFKQHELSGLLSLLTNAINFVSSGFAKPLLDGLMDYFSVTTLRTPPSDVDLAGQARVGHFIQESVEMANEYNLFLAHIRDKLASFAPNGKLSAQEEARVWSAFQGTSLAFAILELLNKVLWLEQSRLEGQLRTAIKNSASYAAMAAATKGVGGDGKAHEFLDEVFYLVKTSITRILSSLDKSAVCSFVHVVASKVLAEDVYELLSDLASRHIRKENVSPTSLSFSGSTTHFNTVVASVMNSLYVAASYVTTLAQSVRDEATDASFPERDRPTVLGCIDQLEELNTGKFRRLFNDRLQALTDLLRPNFRAELDVIKDTNFQVISEAVLLDMEKKLPFSSSLRTRVEKGLPQWKKDLSPEVFEAFFAALCKMLAKAIEALVFSKRFQQIGAVLLDKEIRSICSFLQNQTNSNVRSTFARLSLLCEALMLETKSEIEQFHTLSAGELTHEDIKRLIKLRSDISE